MPQTIARCLSCPNLVCDNHHLYCDQCILEKLQTKSLKIKHFGLQKRISNCRTLGKFRLFGPKQIDYCPKHICRIAYCYRLKASQVPYCDSHLKNLCQVDNCYRIRAKIPEVSGQYYRYCRVHRCVFIDCEALKVNSQTCQQHVCQQLDCDQPIFNPLNDGYCFCGSRRRSCAIHRKYPNREIESRSHRYCIDHYRYPESNNSE